MDLTTEEKVRDATSEVFQLDKEDPLVDALVDKLNVDLYAVGYKQGHNDGRRTKKE